jgi:hypothetical protein
MFIKLIRTIIPSSPISRLVFLLFPISLICILCMPEMVFSFWSWFCFFETPEFFWAYYMLAILLFISGPFVIHLVRNKFSASPIGRLEFILFLIPLICILSVPIMVFSFQSWFCFFEKPKFFWAYYMLAILLFLFICPYVLILVRNWFSASPIVRLVFILFPLICILSVLFSLFSWLYFFEEPEFWAYYMLAILLFISGPFVLHLVRNKFSAVMGAFFYGFNWLLCVGVYDGIYGPCFTHFDFWVGLFLSVIFGYYIGHHDKAKTIAEETPGTVEKDGESESSQCCESLNQSRQDSNEQDTPSECSQPAEDVSRVQD